MNVQEQGPPEYEKLQLGITLLSRQPRQNTKKEVRYIVHLARQCSKIRDLGKSEREKCQDIADTWEKFL